MRRIPDVAGTTVPVGLGFDGKLLGWPTFVFVFGLILTIALVVRKVKGAILIGIVTSTILSVILEFTLHIGPSVQTASRSTRRAGPSWRRSSPNGPPRTCP